MQGNNEIFNQDIDGDLLVEHYHGKWILPITSHTVGTLKQSKQQFSTFCLAISLILVIEQLYLLCSCRDIERAAMLHPFAHIYNSVRMFLQHHVTRSASVCREVSAHCCSAHPVSMKYLMP